MSLQRLLDAQQDSMVTHETLPIPWHNEPDVVDLMIGRLLERDASLIGDVGYYWLNHVERMLEVVPNARFICLKRDRQEVIESMWAHSRGLNVHPTDDWFRMYPRYDTDRKAAIGLMWDDYYTQAEKLQSEQFVILGIESLNTLSGVKQILDFAGIPASEHILLTGIKVNESKTTD